MKYFKNHLTYVALTFILTLNACDRSSGQPNEVEELPAEFIINENKDKVADYTDIEKLPKDTGGEQIAYIKGSTTASHGYYTYTPSGYATNEHSYPLIISLHGAGKRGNSKDNPEDLRKMLWLGPFNLINKGEWSPTYPVIVVAPKTSTEWEPKALHNFIK